MSEQVAVTIGNRILVMDSGMVDLYLDEFNNPCESRYLTMDDDFSLWTLIAAGVCLDGAEAITREINKLRMADEYSGMNQAEFMEALNMKEASKPTQQQENK